MGDFVRPTTIRLTLAGGQTVDIAARLTHGETEDMYARMSPDGVTLDRRTVRTAKLLAYLVAWSLTQDDGAPVPYTPALPEIDRLNLIRSLDHDLAVEIYAAIQAHEEAEAQARVKKKRMRGGIGASDPISASPSGVAGPSGTSAP